MNTRYSPIDIKKVHNSAYSIALFIVKEVGKKVANELVEHEYIV
jgi:hypothetical protein